MLLQQGSSISRRTLFNLIEKCIQRKDWVLGNEVKSLIVKKGLESDAFLGSHLIRMFSSFGSLSEADLVFNKLSSPTVYTWNAIISAHGNLGQSERAIDLYTSLVKSDTKANEYVYVAVLKACTNMTALAHGNLLFSCIIEDGLESDVFICNSSMDMYSKCGCLEDAHRVFCSMIQPDAVSWNALITGYAKHACDREAVQVLQQMLMSGLYPDDITFSTVVKACAATHDVSLGELVHHCVTEHGLTDNVHVGNVLIHMYMACGNVEDANNVFEKLTNPDVVTWSTMISGYALHGHGELALTTFEWMQGEGLKPNKVTYPSILKACGTVSALYQGNLIHALIIENGFGLDAYIVSALIDMYAKCGTLDDASKVFETFPQRSEVALNSMISSYAQNEHGKEAFQLFHRFEQLGFKPDRVMFLNVIKSCAIIVALDWGKLLHDQITRCGYVDELSIGNALIDMYSKCGSLADACNVFEGMPNRGVITWSAMLAGYALHNEYDVVLECFEEMQKIGIKPNHITFLSLLSACGHKGLIDKAYDYFYSMRAGYGIKPATEHYNCMIDLLGRAGRVDEAEYLLLTMPYKNKFLSWKSLLSHSKVYRNVQLGRRCFDHLIAIDSGDASLYALMLDIYAEANMWKEVRQIQEMKNSACARRSPAKAIIPVGTVVHDFIDGDQRHAESCRIYARLKEIGKKMDEQKLFLHLPPIWKLRSIDEDKEDRIGVHCELLATVFGLMVTHAGTTMRIAKNLKICRDCHTAIKFISKFEKREIMLMDNACVHHIKDGLCSCKDLF